MFFQELCGGALGCPLFLGFVAFLLTSFLKIVMRGSCFIPPFLPLPHPTPRVHLWSRSERRLSRKYLSDTRSSDNRPSPQMSAYETNKIVTFFLLFFQSKFPATTNNLEVRTCRSRRRSCSGSASARATARR